MKAISLVFEYDFDKQKESGRTWGKIGYKSKAFIFEYSAASFATFAHHNPGVDYEILTDDEALLRTNMNKYDVDWSSFKIIEDRPLIESWKNHRYCFYPAMMHLKMYENEKELLVKLDNDLECLAPISDTIKNDKIYFWKHERNVSSGREYWGERAASKLTFGTDNFDLYNIGVLSIPEGDKKHLINSLVAAGIKMSEADISSIVRFPEDPGLKVPIWSCSEQTAYCFVISQSDYKVATTEHIINHHCYGFDSKKDCIKSASYLLKNKGSS
jgi:hypothetical protein